MSREQFRKSVFERDGGLCVFCKAPAVDAHHILERRLFADGGYDIRNGASVCEKHHLDCEMTRISVEDVRLACGITQPYLPEHLYSDQTYDKWGNPILANGTRLRGELFHDESVQKILRLGGVLHLYGFHVKYPRTYHLPWSDGVTDDDRVMSDLAAFEGRRVIVTEKLDGENTTMYSDHIHARSVDGQSHPSQDWVKNFWSKIRYSIPEAWRICGENLFAKHSIEYSNLSTYFFGFSVWNSKNECLPWDDTATWLGLLDIQSVPVLFDGKFDIDAVKLLWTERDYDSMEGYVLRLADGFSYRDFKTSVGKFVRPAHVKTVQHWRFGQAMRRNTLKENL